MDGISTCITVTEWAGDGTAIILGMILGTILGITVTDITIVGTTHGTIVVGTRPGITVVGIALGIIAVGTRLGITAVSTILGITVTVAGTAADTIAVSTMDTTVV